MTSSRLAVPVAVVAILTAVAGCGESVSEADRQFAEQVEVARRHAREREDARRRAMRTVRAMHPRLLTVAPAAGCRVEYAPIAHRDGVLPIACGNLGEAWPLTIDRGVLRCETRGSGSGRIVVFSAPGGTEYALNVPARAVGYESEDSILQTAEHRGGGSGRLLRIGLRLCAE